MAQQPKRPQPSDNARPTGEGLSLLLRLVAPDPLGAAERASSDAWSLYHVSNEGDSTPAAAEVLDEGSSSATSTIQTPLCSPTLAPLSIVTEDDVSVPHGGDDSFYEQGYKRADRPAAGQVIPPISREDSLPARDALLYNAAYFARVQIDQPGRSPEAPRLPPFHLHIDTGSSLSWVFGSDCQELMASGSCRPAPLSWKAHPIHSKIFHHGYSAARGEDKKLARRLTYADGCQALLVLPRRERFDSQSTLLHLNTHIECYDWDRTRWVSPIVLPYVFALAIAVNEKLDKDVMHGTLGLGLESDQGKFPDGSNYPSLLYAIQRHVYAPSVEETPGITLYIGLRAVPHYIQREQLHLYESFLAFTRWPCVGAMPEFSPKIKVVQDPQAILANGRTWDVTCTGIELIDKDTSLGGLGYAAAKFIPLTPAAPPSADPKVSQNSNAHPPRDLKEGLRILLDTGSSVSWLPPDIIRQIAAHYGVDLTRHMDQSTRSVTGPEFVVPKKGQTSLHKVALYFEGLDANTVRVEVFADQFIYGAHPKTGALEGLMFSTEKRCVFGLNWFHANWVKMCAPKDEKPYVQLALQEHVPAMVIKHQLPPKEK